MGWERRLQFQQAAQRAGLLGLVVDQLGVILERLVIAVAAGLLQLVDGLRIEQMGLAIRAPLIIAARIQDVAVDLAVGKAC